MIFIFGKRMLGKCDHVPGFFHVATQFYHIDYIPLIPLQSWVVISSNGNKFRGVPIPLSGKSVVCAWGRLLTFIAAAIFLVISLIAVSEGRGPAADWLLPALGAVLSGGACAFLMFHSSCTKASFYRASQLGGLVGLSAAGQAELQRIYGQAAGRGFEVMPMGDFHNAAGFENGSPNTPR